MAVKSRVFLTGVGGQGTLTATKILAWAAMAEGLPVTAGEIHGMAQRGGVVESTVLMGGYISPRIGPGEADVLLGFEPLETLRALPYLAPKGAILSNSETMPPIGVSLGRDDYPELERVRARAHECSETVHFLPCLSLGREAGSPQSANMVLLGALAASGLTPIRMATLEQVVRDNLKAAFLDMNLKALALGADAVSA
jgi:indolepyruvate ferredoxin oxidoreductase beta subunit